MDINIQLTSAGADADNFTLAYYLSPGTYVDFATFVSRATLLAGADFTIPDGSTLVKITSIGVCTNEIILTINVITTTSFPLYYGIQIRTASDGISICSSSFYQALINAPIWGEGTSLYNFDENGQPTTPIIGDYVVYGEECENGCPVYNLINGVVGSSTAYMCYPSTTTTSTTTTTP